MGRNTAAMPRPFNPITGREEPRNAAHDTINSLQSLPYAEPRNVELEHMDLLSDTRKVARAQMLAEIRAKAAYLQDREGQWEGPLMTAVFYTVYDNCPVEDVTP